VGSRGLPVQSLLETKTVRARVLLGTTFRPWYYHRLRTYAKKCDYLQSKMDRGKLRSSKGLHGFLVRDFRPPVDPVVAGSSPVGLA